MGAGDWGAIKQVAPMALERGALARVEYEALITRRQAHYGRFSF